ncbi:luciferase-like monooxygenase [Halopolyspora algeriensis]|uniref:Luciferase-like monooxygenase n=2 Tax=Halopolyspora algeriensis TaxID=1500506 RepID=A0A368VYN5_9ACTN|nr:luciferase-like monooxygenase [Halopolyspora algeriensis]
MAEEYGFDHAWTYDHLGWRSLVDKAWFDAVPTLTAAATVTSRIKLGTLVASPTFRHPVHFARELTALDDVSDGRFLLGVGAGSSGFDTSVLGQAELPGHERVDRFGEFLELLDAILTQDSTTYRGKYFSAVEARRAPGCVQTPRMPFVVAANSPRSMELAARFGNGWVTTGRPAGSEADDPEAWWRSVREKSEQFSEALEAAGRVPARAPRYLQADAGPRYSLSSVEHFRDVLGRAGELGFTDVITHWPRTEPPYAGQESIVETIAAEVLPSLKEA